METDAEQVTGAPPAVSEEDSASTLEITLT
jgi:hypothetical protein